MSRKRLLISGFLALVFGALVSRSVYRMLDSATPAPAQPEVDAVVAARDLQAGIQVEDEDLKIVKVRADSLPPECFHEKSLVIGRGAMLPMARGDFVLPTRLAVENGDRYSDLLSSPMRALSIRASAMADAGFVRRGARIDVLVTRTRKDRNEQTTTVLKNIEIIAVGSNAERGSGRRAHLVRIVTLLVSPDEAQKLTQTGLRGRARLSLRNSATSR